MYERTEEILSALQSGDLGPVRERTQKELDRIIRGIGRGILTVSEAMGMLLRDQYCWNRRRVFDALGLTLPMPETDWLELREAWYNAVRGIRRELPPEGPARERALRLRRLLDLLDALAVPVFSLERPPADVPVPSWMPVYVGGIVQETEPKALFLNLTDDGGLRGNPAPVGASFLLRGDFGVEVHFRVTGVERSSREESGQTWIGVGFVTHLTAQENRTDPTLRVSLGEKGGALVRWQADEGDRAAAETDPLWADYRAWCRHMDDKQTLWLDGLLSRLS